ncbi:MAG TPA: hypothetical protein VHQ01_12315, partial [Pyrinomonadaceae bacterium]|nr:hypothetical protein [Pyrinomonadaceae bacterium]
MTFLNTFRGRLLLILALLLVATLGVQYYLNLVMQKENDNLREMQDQAITASIALGFASITSQEDRVQDLIAQPDQTFFDEKVKERVRDIIIIDNNWQVTDSLNPDYLPTTDDAGTLVKKNLKDLDDLPPLREGRRLGDDLKQFPNTKGLVNKS